MLIFVSIKENHCGEISIKNSAGRGWRNKKILNKNEAYTVGARLHLVYLVALGHSTRKLSELHNISFKQMTN